MGLPSFHIHLNWKYLDWRDLRKASKSFEFHRLDFRKRVRIVGKKVAESKSGGSLFIRKKIPNKIKIIINYPFATFRLRHFFSYYTDPFPEIQPVEFEAFRSFSKLSRCISPLFRRSRCISPLFRKSRQWRYFQFM